VLGNALIEMWMGNAGSNNIKYGNVLGLRWIVLLCFAITNVGNTS
jgi:hypothetical protein